MWLRKAKNNAQDLPHPGQVDALDGLEAAWAQESSACDAVMGNLWRFSGATEVK